MSTVRNEQRWRPALWIMMDFVEKRATMEMRAYGTGRRVEMAAGCRN